MGTGAGEWGAVHITAVFFLTGRYHIGCDPFLPKIYENGKALAEAFESVKTGDYDVILMDIQMSVMNGYEAFDKLKEVLQKIRRL